MNELMQQYWVTKVPKNIEFIFHDDFEIKGKLDTTINTELPKPYGKHIVLSREQERELFLRFNYAKYRATKVTEGKNIRKHLTRAAYLKEIIAYHNIPLCYNLIGKLKTVNLDREELESEVFYSLNLAIDRFDINRNCKFSPYATMTIRHDVFQRVKFLDRHKHNLSLDILDVGGRPECVCQSKFDLRGMFDINRSDACSDVRVLFNNNRRIKSRERLIVNRLFGLNGKKQIGLIQLAKEFGVSKQRIHEIKQTVLRKIRDRYKQVMKEDAALTSPR